MKQLLLIDAVNFLFRAYYAIAPMTNHEGASTNAIFGFIRSVQKLLNDYPTAHVAIVFDGINNKQSRSAIYADYKIHRKQMPLDLIPQLQLALQWCEISGLPHLAVEGVEADDTIGSIATWAEAKGTTIRICSSDKDLCQLVSNRIHLVNPSKDYLEIDAAKVKELFGVHPHQMVDYLAIIGDASDNIPGIEGFGPKTAAALLEEFTDLQTILANPHKVSGKKKQETLIASQEIALLSQKLATIVLDIPFPQEEDFFLKKGADHEKLKKFYLDLQLVSLLKEMQEPVVPVLENYTYHLVDTEAALQAVCHQIMQNACIEPSMICLDTETSCLNWMDTSIVGVGLGLTPHEAWYIPLNSSLDKKIIHSCLTSLFTAPHLTFYGHNIKFDLHALTNENLPLPKISFDTMLASYLLTPQNHRHNLDDLTLMHFDFHKTPIEQLIGKGKLQKSMRDVAVDQVCHYCCEDVDYTTRLKEKFLPDIERHQLSYVLNHIELPLIQVLRKMERRGIFVDADHLKEISLFLTQQLKQLEQQIYALAGETFNINSPKQLSIILFEKMQIAPVKKITTGYSTNAAVLEELKDKAPIAQLILSYRSLEKLRSTYIEPLPQQINARTGRIHPTFNQSVAATGRLSCQDPNLQNIPIRSSLGQMIRHAFKPQEEGFSFLSADYSQIELRLLAHLSEDPNLIKAFNAQEDVHAFTASNLFQVSLKDVTYDMRQKAKAVNFGVLYGQQAFGLSQGLGVSYQEAAQFIEAYFDRYPKVQDFLEFCKEEARKTGYAVTMTGRKRPIPDINSKNVMIRSASERLAINTPLQGTAADLIKLAMIDIDHLLDNHPHAHMLLQIHDELLFEAPMEEISLLSTHVQRAMEQVMKLKVPLEVHISIGKNWGEC